MFHRVALSVPSASRQGGGPGAWVQSGREDSVTMHGVVAADDILCVVVKVYHIIIDTFSHFCR